MIVLKNIKKNESTITCSAFLEYCKEPVDLVYDIKENSFESFKFPKGFEYCTSHIAKAKRYLKKVVVGEEPLLKDKVIMWY